MNDALIDPQDRDMYPFDPFDDNEADTLGRYRRNVGEAIDNLDAIEALALKVSDQHFGSLIGQMWEYERAVQSLRRKLLTRAVEINRRGAMADEALGPEDAPF